MLVYQMRLYAELDFHNNNEKNVCFFFDSNFLFAKWKIQNALLVSAAARLSPVTGAGDTPN